MSVYDVGDLVRVSVAFTNSTAAAADPTTVTLKYRLAHTTTTTSLIYGTDAAVVKDGTGLYHVDLTVTAAGDWYVRWEGTGDVVAATDTQFVVGWTPLA